MLNKTLKVVGIVAGIAAIAAGVAALCEHIRMRRGVMKCYTCCDCENGEDCECHGKYDEDCVKVGDCLVEEGTDVEEFAATEA